MQHGRAAWNEVGDLGDWLGGHEWDAFATLTFDERFGPGGPSGARALHLGRNWLETLPHRPGWYLAVETGRFGRTHLHALIAPGSPRVPRKALWRSWFKRFGRARLQPVDPARGLNAAYYVAKYVTKAPDLWDLSGPWLPGTDIHVVPVLRNPP